MKHLNCIFLTITFLLVCTVAVLGQVSLAESREALLVKAERLTAASPDSALKDRFAEVTDPFNLPEDRKNTPAATLTSAPAAGDAQQREPVSDHAILLELSEKIRPTGVMRFGEDVLLLFGERRVRVGDFLSMQHQGKTYKLQVVKADNRAFMLRLNDELISKRIQ